MKLKALGRDAADQWLEKHGDDIGGRSTCNYREFVAAMTQDTDELPVAKALQEHDGFYPRYPRYPQGVCPFFRFDDSAKGETIHL